MRGFIFLAKSLFYDQSCIGHKGIIGRRHIIPIKEAQDLIIFDFTSLWGK
jgi:hypothetical protein